MNLLFTIPTIEVGGAEIFLARIATELSNIKGVKIYVLDFEKERRDKDVIKLFSNKIVFIKNPIGTLFWRRAIYKLELIFNVQPDSIKLKIYNLYIKYIIKRYRINHLHSHLYRSDKIISKLKLSIKRTTTLHGCYNIYTKEKFDELYQILNSFDHIIYITSFNLSPIKKLKNSDKILEKTIKIYNGVFINEPKLNTITYNFHKQPMKVIIVSRCIEEKGWDIVIEAVLELINENKNITLDLLGDGDYLESLQKKYQFPGKINFHGKITKTEPYIINSHVCCFPSIHKTESFPNSILEYMQYGKPIISTAGGEIPLMMKSNNNETCGYLTPDNYTKKELTLFFKEKLNSYIENPEQILIHGRIALNCIKKFDIKKTAQSYLNIYNT